MYSRAPKISTRTAGRGSGAETGARVRSVADRNRHSGRTCAGVRPSRDPARTRRARAYRAWTAAATAPAGNERYRRKLFAIRLVVTLTGYAIARPTVQRTHAGAIGRAA